MQHHAKHIIIGKQLNKTFMPITCNITFMLTILYKIKQHAIITYFSAPTQSHNTHFHTSTFSFPCTWHNPSFRFLSFFSNQTLFFIIISDQWCWHPHLLHFIHTILTKSTNNCKTIFNRQAVNISQTIYYSHFKFRRISNYTICRFIQIL